MLTRSNIKRSISMLSGTWGLTEDQLALREMALTFAQQELAPYTHEWNKKSFFPIDTMRKGAELGLASLYIPSTSGGSGLSRLDSSIVFEALGTGCNSTACYYSIQNMCNWILDTFGNEAQKEQWAYKLHSFDTVASYCLTEPNSGSDSAAMQTNAVLKGDTYILNGSKSFISGGGSSGLFFVMAKTGPKEISCFLVDRSSPGVSVGKLESKLGWHSMPTNSISFDNVEVPASNMLGPPGTGFKIAMQALDGGRVNISSCGLGTAWEILKRACEYMDQRQQFNTKLKDFQYLRFRTAEEAAKLHASRLLIRSAAQMIDENYALKTPYAAMSKLFSTEAYSEIANFALQCFGGYGILTDFEVERMYRELRILRIVEGTSEVMRMIIARSIFEPKY